MVKIGDYQVGTEQPPFIIAEIGINHNGNLKQALQMLDAAKSAGCHAVKFQKRTIEVVYTAEELAKPRENPFGPTNGDLKRGLEFSREDYEKIDRHCKNIGILWFASPWDEASVDFLEQFHPPCYKLASASLTDAGLLSRVKKTEKPIILSVGMSSEAEIDKAVALLGDAPLILMHCTCLYPPDASQINLRAMRTLMKKYNVPVGYSGHEADTIISAAAVALGACAIERHFTLDRKLWGSDQKASIEPEEMRQLVQNIKLVEAGLGSPSICCMEDEKPVKAKLRRVESI